MTELGVVGTIDLSHPATAERRDDSKAAANKRPGREALSGREARRRREIRLGVGRTGLADHDRVIITEKDGIPPFGIGSSITPLRRSSASPTEVIRSKSRRAPERGVPSGLNISS